MPNNLKVENMKVCILGGTGFVGRALAAQCATAGHYVRVITRHRERQRDLLVLPNFHLIEGDPDNVAMLRQELRGMDAVVNLIGVLNPSKRVSFEQAHVELPRKIAGVCQDLGVPRLLHMSALGAAPDAPSAYLRSKAAGEAAVIAAAPRVGVTIFRPSVIFGAHDSFTNRFAQLLRLIPFSFPLACPQARLQPVYVNDVTRAFLYALAHRHTAGEIYQLCGPQAYTLYEIVEFIARTAQLPRRIVPLNQRLSLLQATIMEHAPGKPFTRDNYLSLTRDNVCGGAFPAEFGFAPSALETVVPAYLQARVAQ